MLPAVTRIRAASDDDVPAIRSILAANRGDPSLFQQSDAQIRRTLADFLVAGDPIVGCAAVHSYGNGAAEILAVAVDPAAHGRGIGSALMAAAIAEATRRGGDPIWLATAKPAYFARFGFVPVSRWQLGVGVLSHKLRLVFQQPIARWVPAIVGRHSWMHYIRRT